MLKMSLLSSKNSKKEQIRSDRDNKLVSEEKNLTLVDSFGDLLDDNIEVDEVQVESCTLVDEACSYLVIIDWLSCAIPLDDILD